MKLIMENWRKYLIESKSPLTDLDLEEEELLKVILNAAKKMDIVDEARAGSPQSRQRSRKRRSKERKLKKRQEREETEKEMAARAQEFWTGHVTDILNNRAKSSEVSPERQMIIRKAAEKLGCSDQLCDLWDIPLLGTEEILKDMMPSAWKTVDEYYSEWHEKNKSIWMDKFYKSQKQFAQASSTDLSELPGLENLKGNDTYSSLSKKLCPGSLTVGISVGCLVKLIKNVGLGAIDLFVTEEHSP